MKIESGIQIRTDGPRVTEKVLKRTAREEA
jgi:hypothetical protein